MNLFVANFDDDVTEGHLEELFGNYGEVTSAQIWIDFKTDNRVVLDLSR
jgi:RNA recognition motif-containing protein